jgi:hypothetical protein
MSNSYANELYVTSLNPGRYDLWSLLGSDPDQEALPTQPHPSPAESTVAERTLWGRFAKDGPEFPDMARLTNPEKNLHCQGVDPTHTVKVGVAWNRRETDQGAPISPNREIVSRARL